jgi:hypothetical protein
MAFLTTRSWGTRMRRDEDLFVQCRRQTWPLCLHVPSRRFDPAPGHERSKRQAPLIDGTAL